MSNLTIRTATVQDTSKLLEIYDYYVKNTAITFEYETPSEQEFASRISHILEKYPYLVAELDGRIVGYAYAGEFHKRAACQWNVEASIYIHKEYKKKGIGRVLYDALEKILKLQNILNINVSIAKPIVEDEYLTNDSIYFHEKLGFDFVGEFHKCGYKFNRWYHLVWMEKWIGEHMECQPEIIWFPNLKLKCEDIL